MLIELLCNYVNFVSVRPIKKTSKFSQHCKDRHLDPVPSLSLQLNFPFSMGNGKFDPIYLYNAKMGNFQKMLMSPLKPRSH